MAMVAPLLLSASGIVLAALVYLNREKPDRQRQAQALMVLAVGQVALGALAWFVISR